MLKRVLLGCAALSLAGLFLFMDAAPSSARAATVSPDCQGTGDFAKSGHHYKASDGGVDEVPLTDDVTWAGSITPPSGASPWGYSGKIEVELPPPFGSLPIDSWSGTTDSTGNNGVKHYDLPSFVPRGVEFSVTGGHTQGDKSCTGHVTVEVEGSAMDSPFAPASLVGTAVTGGVLALAGRAKGGASA